MERERERERGREKEIDGSWMDVRLAEMPKMPDCGILFTHAAHAPDDYEIGTF